MNILIVRTFGSKIDATSYNVQEIGLAKAWVRAGHQADVVLYGGFGDDRTVLMPVDDTGVVRYDERLLGEDAYVEEGNVDGDDPDRFISVYYLSGVSILKNGFFFSLRELSRNYDYIQVHEYDQITSWLYYTDRRLRDKVVIYHGPYYHEFNRGYNLKCKVFDHTFLKLKSAPYTTCYTKSTAAAEFLKGKGFKNVYPVGVGLDTDAWDEVLENEGAGATSGIAGTEFGKALKKADAILNADVSNLSGTIADMISGVEPKGGTGAREQRADRFFTYIYVGKIEPRRNSMFLADIADRLLSAHADVRFMVVGDGDVEYKGRFLAKLRRWIDKGRVIYASKAAQTEMPVIYRMADCMLFPTIYDIYGMVLAEAIYFGLPVITSGNGGADMLYEDGKNAIVMSDMTLEAWIKAAEQMYSDVDMRNRIRVALLEEKDKLSWDNVVRRMLKTWPGLKNRS